MKRENEIILISGAIIFGLLGIILNQFYPGVILFLVGLILFGLSENIKKLFFTGLSKVMEKITGQNSTEETNKLNAGIQVGSNNTIGSINVNQNAEIKK